MSNEVRRKETVRVVVPKGRAVRIKRWMSVLMPAAGGLIGGAMGASLGRAFSGFRPNYGRIVGGGAGGIALGALGGHAVSRVAGSLLDEAASDNGIPVFTSDAVYKKAAESITKTAAKRSIARRVALTKAAGIATDYLATLPTHMAIGSGIPLISVPATLANAAGGIGGLIADPEDDKNPKTDGLSVIPGVASFRMAQRRRRVMDESNRRGARGTANLVAEEVGPLSSGIIGGGTGALIGGALGSAFRDNLGRRHTGAGALAGAIAGTTIPTVIGMIIAGIRRKRSLEEQAKADTTGRAVAKYLVPGLSQYDSLKRLGASSHLDDKSKKQKKK